VVAAVLTCPVAVPVVVRKSALPPLALLFETIVAPAGLTRDSP
jgi:hypothetical protein